MTLENQTLKKISVSELKLGMFVNELCGSWNDHPFTKTRFKLVKLADLEALRNSPVAHVWIDTAGGCGGKQPERKATEAGIVEPAAIEEAAQPAPAVEFSVEVTRAAAVCDNAKVAVTAMFGEARMGKAVDTREMESLVDEISGSVMRNPGALISLARLKAQDDYTYMHSVAVCGLMIALSRQLGLDEHHTHEAGLAGLVHDIGKATVDLDILNKPGALTDAEFEHMKSHPVAGHAMLLEGNTVGEIPLDVCLHHHEKIDGSGYPDKLDGEKLSLYAKMGAVCDVYDAITSDRPYKAGWDPATSIRKINEWSYGHFDDTVLQAFIKTVGIYPVGALVRLESDLLGVVCEVRSEKLLTPVVKTFYCARRNNPTRITRVDLAASNCDDKIAGWENPLKWSFPDLTELWAGDSAPR